MNILTKLTLRFSFIVASILVLFSIAVYTFSASYRKEEFYQRLESRALTTVRLLVSVQEVNKDLLRIIDQNSMPALPEEQVLIFDEGNELDYSTVEGPTLKYTKELLDKVRKQRLVRFEYGDQERLGLLYQEEGQEYVVLASALDRYGRSKLRNLGTVLILGLLVGIGMIVLTGRWFAAKALAPLAKINNQVSNISAGSLDQRIDEGNKKDEIARLAMNFNQMLARLETAFEVQQSFVSNASHELRTPLAAIRSQLQVTLAKDRTQEEYRQVLQSLQDDTTNFAELTNGLLMLAQSGVDSHRLHFKDCRVDEVLFNAQEELAKLRPGYHFLFDYETLPENENALTIRGNEQLLITAFVNFMDNACKFSPDNTVNISLSSDGRLVEIRFKDNGVGIPEEEIDRIFTPFYRSSNGQNVAKGHGIGLSLCQKIVQLHKGTIQVESVVSNGSVFIVKLPVSK